MSHIENRFFIVDKNDPKISDILGVALSHKEINENQYAIKLHSDDHNKYDFLSGFYEYSCDEIMKKEQDNYS